MSRALAALALAAALAVTAAVPAAAKPRDPAKTPVATGKGGAVATVDALATRAAAETLRRGGNAVDAAVVAAAVLGVTEPFSCGIGGGGFMLVREANGRIRTIDSREKAPRAMTERSFLGEDGKPIPFDQAVTSGLGVGVPGTVAGWERALGRYGTISLAQALRPAEQIARRGFVVDKTFFEQTEANVARFGDFPATERLYLDDDGTPRDVGTVLRNRDLARAYRLLGRDGSDAFYRGPIADAIVRTVRNPPTRGSTQRNVRPGLMTRADLRRYTAPLREPTRVRFMGLDVYGMAPPSSGGSTVGEILNIFESAAGLQPTDRERALHRFLEASKLAFADRNRYLGDPAYVDVPLAGLLSQGFADERAGLIGERALDAPQGPGTPPGAPAPRASASVERSRSTTHLTVADADGRTVSYTFTIEQTGGSAITVPGYGFILNNELTDFNFAPGTANSAAGGKRPRSSMAPTIVERRGAPLLALGSPGGSTIITTVAQVLLERLRLGRSLPDAIAAPRLSQRNGSTTTVEPGVPESADGTALAARGHAFATTAEIGAVTGVEFLSDGRLLAAAERTRRGGGAATVVRRRAHRRDDARDRPAPRPRR